MKTNQLLITVCAALFLFTTASAQDNEIGVFVGANMSNMSLDVSVEGEGVEGIDPESSTSAAFGAFVDLKINKSMSVCVAPTFLTKGAHQSEDMGEYMALVAGTPMVNAAMLDIGLKASYIEIPLMLKMTLGSGDMQPYIFAGPTIGFLTDAKMGINFLGIGVDFNVKNIAKRMDYGAIFGCGVRLPVGNNSFFIQGCYRIGMTNFIDEDEIKDMIAAGTELGEIAMGLIGQMNGGFFKTMQEEPIDLSIDGKTKGLQIDVGFSISLGG